MPKIILVSLLLLLLTSCALPNDSAGKFSNGNEVNSNGKEVNSSIATTSSSNASENASQPEEIAQTEEQSEKKGFWSGIFSRFFGKKNDTDVSNDKETPTPSLAINPNIQKAMVRQPVISKEKPSLISEPIGANLSICGLGMSCSGDMGSINWRKEVSVSAGSMKRALDWKADSGQADGGLLEISLQPMNDAWPAKTVYSQNVAYGQFVFDFSALLHSDNKQKIVSTSSVPDKAAVPVKPVEPLSTEKLQAAISPSKLSMPKLPSLKTPIAKPVPVKETVSVNKLVIDFKKLTALQPVYYVRIVPLKGGQIAGKPSNEIKVRFTAPADDVEFKKSSPPKAYEVEIKSFQPLRAPDKGVCSHAMILDTAGFVPKAGGIGYEQKQIGDRICPLPYKGAKQEAWYESLWNAVSSGMDWVSEAYNDLKSAVVDAVGSIACGGNATCKMALSAGLDMGLVALGIPPTLPNFDQLVDGGFDYLAGELSAAAGCPDAICREAIKKGLKEALDQKKNTNPSCMDEITAHDMGIEPLCLPDGMKAHFDPAAMHRGAEVVLTVKRTSLKIDNEKALASSSYRVLLSAFGKNADMVGASIKNIEPYNKSLKIDKPLQGEIFRSVVLPIPYLAPGDSVDIPVQLVATDYWVPGHKELMGGWTTVTYKDGWPQYQYNDWWMFYYGAQLNLVAQIDGCFYLGGNECIVSTDGLETTLPMTLYVN